MPIIELEPALKSAALLSVYYNQTNMTFSSNILA